MTDRRKMENLSTNFNLLSERISEDWEKLTNLDVEKLEELKEKSWAIVCRRGKGAN